MSTSISPHLDGDSNDVMAKDSTSKPWDCSGSYQYPLPTTEGDPWDSLLKPLLESNTLKCNAWVDEVQNLLIFAGLFSSVVTYFAVQTYQDLQEDPVVALLTQIAATTATNGSISPPLPFTPAAPTVRLNIFLFLSLILSLSTVLVGIVALQWVREHRQVSNSLTPQNMFATLHMRNEALDQWRVPQIFAALPLLLQSALVLFFAGIIQLLTGTSTIVLIPVACVIGVTVFFLVITTILPTVQAVTLSYSGLTLNNNIPVPCPYKSPQAQAFRQFVTSWQTLFSAISFFFAAVYWVILRLCLLSRLVGSWTNAMQIVGNLFKRTTGYVSMLFDTLSRQALPLIRALSGTGDLQEWHGFDYMRPHIFQYWCQKSWLEFDIAWMSIRDNYFESILAQDTWLFQNREDNYTAAALYDTVRGLCNELIKDNFNSRVNPESAIILAYHCVMSLYFPSVDNLDMEDPGLMNTLYARNHYLATLLRYRGVTPLQPFTATLQVSDFKLLWDEASFIFLSFIHEEFINISSRSPIVTSHFAEVYLRLLNQLYSKPYVMDHDPQSIPVPEVAFEAEELYVLKIYNVPNQPFTLQWALSITSFFNVLGNHSIPYSRICRSFHTHPFFRGYSTNFWRQLKYEIHTRTVHEDTVHEAIYTLSLIIDILDRRLKDSDAEDSDHTVHARSRFIFHAVAIHLYSFRHWDVTRQDLASVVEATIGRLRVEKNRLRSLGIKITLSPGPDIHDDSYDVDHIPWFTSTWWTKLFPEFSEYDQDDPAAIDMKHSIGASSTVYSNGESWVDVVPS